MAFQSVPNTCEVSLIFSVNGQEVQNTFHAQLPGYDPTSMAALADALDDIVGAVWIPLLPSACIYLLTEVRGLENENDYVVQNSDNSGAGSVVNTEVSNNVTFAIKRLSALTGRSARGRIFWPSMVVANLQSNSNLVLATAADSFVLAAAAITSAMAVAGWSPVIVSRFSNGVKRTTGVTFPLVSWAYGNLGVDSQRARLT